MNIYVGTEFHNPYTFIPSPKRPSDGFAGDFDPLQYNLDHASLHPKSKLWTGYIPIKLTTITPLVLLKDDGRERDSDEHQTYDVHDRIPESSLRGMLRSAYEVVTNSRYGSFDVDNKKYGRMLDGSLIPAKTRDQLSPADRLFGWASQGQGNHGGYKGRIRVVCGEVVPEVKKDPENDEKQEIIQRFEGGDLPLAILSAPKPSYARFYVAKNKQGDPQKDGLSKKKVGYDSSKGLRGRKQYWHHKGLEIDPSKPESEQAKDYWHPLVEDRTQLKCNNRYQEYRRPDQLHKQSKNGWQQKDKQNRSIKGWIKPGTVFKAELYVQNLQSEEIGALLWLLLLPENHYFRIGYGKPLGFGSVRMEIDEGDCPDKFLPLGTGKDWVDYYAVFDADVVSPANLDKCERNQCIHQFKESMEKVYSQQQGFDNLPFISGFLQALRGPKTDLPIHYPRLEEKPHPEGKSFDWFKANDSKKGPKLTLPAVTDVKGLPYNSKT